MKIFSAAQIKKWDAFTIANEPVASIDLMERAAGACYNWITNQFVSKNHFLIFCGKGNNGGDGLAIARMLLNNKYSVSVYILESHKKGTPDFETNLARLYQCTTDVHFIQSQELFPTIKEENIIIDALFGIGLNTHLEGISAALVQHLNRFNKTIISIDIPSGMFADSSSKNNTVIKAAHTLSFQNYKLAFLLPENQECCGNIHLLNINLHKKFEADEDVDFTITDCQLLKKMYKPREPFSHKGNYGHAALIAGSYGMMGAAVLSAEACLRSGVGKLTCYIPECGYEVLQCSVPEAMCFTSGDKYLLSAEKIENYDSVGIGPGIGVHQSSALLLKEIFTRVNKPMLIDADAINIIAKEYSLLPLIPTYSILTPHPKEMERLFGNSVNDFERIQLALQKSKELKLFIVLKGHNTFISTPEGKGFFNNTGNAGMATAGSGDVLSGIITGLLAQGYSPLQCCLLGTYLHGMAGDFAAAKFSQEAMVAGDICDFLGESFKTLY